MRPNRIHIPKTCKYCNNQSYMTPKKENFNKTKNQQKLMKKLLTLKK